MLDINEVLFLHERLIKEFGGALGVKDIGLLESAISRAFQTFDGNDLYKSVEEKASRASLSIILLLMETNELDIPYLGQFFLPTI